MGEGKGGGGQHKLPPPLHPLPPGEGRFLGGFFQNVRRKFLDFGREISKEEVIP
jgi:hypothetical protein